jgi:coatomer protein complex subunit epsilon
VDAVALIVQIHLHQNRNDLAMKEVAAARRWAQDSLLVNLAESWVGLRLVGYNRILVPVFLSLEVADHVYVL